MSNSAKVAMAPGDIRTEPSQKLVFNAPFSEKNVYHCRLTNLGVHRIGWAIKTMNKRRLNVDPPAGELHALESQLMTVSCERVDYVNENMNNDRQRSSGRMLPRAPSRSDANGWRLPDGCAVPLSHHRRPLQLLVGHY